MSVIMSDAPREAAADADEDARWRAMLDPIRNAPAGQSYVVAQLGQSVDGRIATLSGESRWINGDGALDHLHRLRACVDAVVVGIGTVLADDPILNVRRGVNGPNPARVVIDPSGRMQGTARCLANDGCRRIVVTAAERNCEFPGVETIRCARVGGRLPPEVIVAELRARGLNRILIEGGAWTVSAFMDAGMVDRLHMLVAPVILGSGKPGLNLLPIGRLAEAERPTARIHVLGETDVLFDCDLRNARKGS
jgi:diaminohydroxyphosphoribosylaminopyrimidine deaminase / 5-amino-6-(5-phosphoribosylamino)uracil reductase